MEIMLLLVHTKMMIMEMIVEVLIFLKEIVMEIGDKNQNCYADDAAADDEFGYSVAISGNYVIVGASYDDDYAANSDSGSNLYF